MIISHVISSIDENNGGPSRSVTHLLSAINQSHPSIRLNLNTGISENPILKVFDRHNIKLTFYKSEIFGRLSGLNKLLTESNSQLFHGHAIWDLPVHQMALTARSLKIPYIITPRGMLEPWALKQKRFKKKIALELYQYKDLKNAACIQATAPMEAENIRALGFKNPIAIIPNGIPLRDFTVKNFDKYTFNKKVLFLSRVHPKKGIENLIKAWSLLPSDLVRDWTLDIIGNGEQSYIDILKSLINEKRLSQRISIKDPVYGKDKTKAYQNADVFVLPTYSENFGIVVAEALACGIPVITTKGTPWEDLKHYDCGWYIEIGVRPLVKTLENALRMSKNRRQQMGENARRLIEAKYDIAAVADQVYELYHWILNESDRPSFVELD